MKETISELIDTYYAWYREECSNPWEEMEWLINCALSSETERGNVMQALRDVRKHRIINQSNK